jgi:hypothetical protein
VLAGPTLGFTEDFAPPDTTAGFMSQAQLSNPGTGGVDGAGDGYLRIAREPLAGRLGANNPGPDYAGDYIAAGVTRVLFWLNDVESDEDLEIHLSVGNQGNLWQSNIGHIPPEGSWAMFEVDLGDSASFTQTRNLPGGSYTLALREATRLLWRHDLPPFGQSPNLISGQVGLDKILLTNEANAVVELPAPRPSLFTLLPARPNPAAPNTVIGATLIEPARVRVSVVSVAGRVVRELHSGALGTGTHAFPWDGRDAQGANVSPGVYFINLRAGQETAVGRITVVR